eukprot:g5503.t1
MSDWETQRKAILPYLQRAAEIETVDKKVAYYCRLYAVEQGIKLEQRDQKADDLLELVLNQLERDKPQIQLDQQADRDHCEKFALNILVKAKKRDEQGIADRDTAKAYYAAFNFVEILKQFGKLSKEIEKERRFAVFRAAEIKKALDENREPPPLIPSQVPIQQEETGSERFGPSPSTESADNTPPLIDYDPGYVIGSKVVFVQHETGSMNSGVITGKAQLVGGFFNIKSVDGTVFNLGALFIAPDLTEGDIVTYFHSDGRQLDCQVKKMNASRWPPMYTLALEDGSIKEVNHSQFVLTSGPITQEEEEALTEITPAIAPKEAKEEESVSINEGVVDKEERSVQHQISWLKRRGRNPSSDTAAESESSETIRAQLNSADESSIQNTSSLPSQVAVQNKELTSQSSLPSKGHQPLSYYDVINEEGTEYEYTQTVQVVNYEPRLKEQQHNLTSGGGFEADSEAIQHAMKLSQGANMALQFNDVEHAISCLNEALAWLTKNRSARK